MAAVSISSRERLVLKTVFDLPTPAEACDFLALRSGLSKTRVKDAMNKGAVWLKRGKGAAKRLRKATSPLRAGDAVELYYDESVLSTAPPEAKCVSDQRHYSVWYKPAGLLAQGTMFGDHCSLVRRAELFFRNSREVFLVHRLDREASGLMLLAHSRHAAARLSELFQRNEVIKRYRVDVVGDLSARSGTGTIELPLDGKSALTEFRVESYEPGRNVSTVDVSIKTGRLHQIRRHFEMIGFPVVGDPRYGKGNKNTEGMKLAAVSLRFRCPFQKREVEFRID